MSSLFGSTGLLVHVAGVVVVSQLLFVGKYREQLFESLNKNATGVLHDAVDKFADAVSLIFPVRGQTVGLGVGTVLQWLVYGAAALYAVYLAR